MDDSNHPCILSFENLRCLALLPQTRCTAKRNDMGVMLLNKDWRIGRLSPHPWHPQRTVHGWPFYTTLCSCQISMGRYEWRGRGHSQVEHIFPQGHCLPDPGWLLLDLLENSGTQTVWNGEQLIGRPVWVKVISSPGGLDVLLSGTLCALFSGSPIQIYSFMILGKPHFCLTL